MGTPQWEFGPEFSGSGKGAHERSASDRTRDAREALGVVGVTVVHIMEDPRRDLGAKRAAARSPQRSV